MMAFDGMTEKWSMPLYGAGPPISDEEFVLFRDYVAKNCGIALDREKKYLLESRLAPLVSESGLSGYAEFYAAAKTDSRRWRDRIIECIVTNETLWFRDSQPWILLRDELLPAVAKRARAEGRKVRIWSAGCSTGQEPYSVAMLISELSRRNALSGLGVRDFDIIGTDISRAAIFLARAGRFDPVSMRRGLLGEWEYYRERYFKRVGNVEEIVDEIKELVRLEKFDLQDDFVKLGQFDLVLLRYVSIYFESNFKRSLYERLAKCLRHNGVMLLGSAEILAESAGIFETERHDQTYIYRVRGK